mmetsp:Transcript_4541/g.12415  ORF Transcript_4541/g.12415 Transcript_4541/m.12415 type:complete len:244 (-) Transcript_4541:49-780(-)
MSRIMSSRHGVRSMEPWNRLSEMRSVWREVPPGPPQRLWKGKAPSSRLPDKSNACSLVKPRRESPSSPVSSFLPRNRYMSCPSSRMVSGMGPLNSFVSRSSDRSSQDAATESGRLPSSLLWSSLRATTNPGVQLQAISSSASTAHEAEVQHLTPSQQQCGGPEEQGIESSSHPELRSQLSPLVCSNTWAKASLCRATVHGALFALTANKSKRIPIIHAPHAMVKQPWLIAALSVLFGHTWNYE